jgi:hypothetical protein
VSRSESKETPATNVDGVLSFSQLQMTQAIETFRAQLSLLIQILTVLVISDVTILGFAFSSQISGVILVAAIVPLIMIIIVTKISRYMIPVIYTALTLEVKIGKGKPDYLVSTFLSSVVSAKFTKELYEISLVRGYDERIERLRKIRLSMFDKKSSRYLLLIFSLLQVLVSILLNSIFNWRFL